MLKARNVALIMAVFSLMLLLSGVVNAGCECKDSAVLLGEPGSCSSECGGNEGKKCWVVCSFKPRCEGITCSSDPICEGDYAVTNSACDENDGQCKGNMEFCVYGCSSGQCNPPPVLPDCEMGAWQDDGCGVFGCASNQMSLGRSPTNAPCNPVAPSHQCVESAQCSGGGGPVSGGGGGAPVSCSCIYPQNCGCPGDPLGVLSGVQTCYGVGIPCSWDSSGGCDAGCNPCDCGSGGDAPPVGGGGAPVPVGTCEPVVNVGVNPNNPVSGADVTITANSKFGYGNIGLTSGGGTNPDPPNGGACGPCDPDNAAWTWTAKAGPVGSYALTFTGEKDGAKCNSVTTLNVVSGAGCPSPVTVAVEPANPSLGGAVKVTAQSSGAYTNVKIDSGGKIIVAGPADCAHPEAQCTTAPYKWVWSGTAPSTAGTYNVKFTSTECSSADTSFIVGTPASSLTKEVAKQLLWYTQDASISQFTLFCDSYDKALNYYSYSAQGESVNTVLSQESAGNVCVLKTGSDSNPGVVFGAPLKVSLSDSNSKMLKVLGDACDSSVKGSAAFRECTGRKVWHKKGSADNGIVIYSKSAITLTTATDEYLRPAADFLRKLFWIQSETTEAVDFVSNAQNLDRLYISILPSGKRISGIIDNTGGSQKMVIEYSGFTQNPCSVINAYFNSLPNPAERSAPCTECSPSSSVCRTAGKYLLKVDGCAASAANQKVCNSWADLTAKTRLQ